MSRADFERRRTRLVEVHVAPRPLSSAEQRRLIELLSVGVTRRLSKRSVVDLSLHLSVHDNALAPEEGDR